MKLHRSTAVALFLLAAVGCTAIVLGLTPHSSVRAQTGCSIQSLTGTYGYAHTGYAITGDLHFFAASGTFTSDGNGGFTGIDSTSLDGQITRNRKYSGTYSVTSGCTGSLVFLNGSQIQANMDFVLTNGGKTVRFIQTDPGTIITGTAELQVPTP